MTDKIGVLFVQAQDELGADGAVHADIMRYLDRDRFEVHVACTAGNGGREPRSLQVLRSIPRLRVRPTRFLPLVGRRPEQLAGAAAALSELPKDFWDLRRYIKTNRIRILHATDRPRNALYAVLLGKLTGAKSVVHVHVKWSAGYGRAATWCVNEADAVFSISQYVTQTVVGMGRPAPEVHTVLNAIDPRLWDPSTDGASLRDELGIPRDVPLLASVSRLFSWKGQRELLRAFALARQEHPRLRLMIVGADTTGPDAPYLRELKDLARELQVADAVVFTGPRSDVPRVMAACDVFTLPSFEEPFGLVFLEAMAMKRPVVALDNGGTPEVVEHGESGLLSPPNDIPALSANIVRLVQDAGERARMGERGRARVVEYFNAGRLAADAAAAYEKILQQRA